MWGAGGALAPQHMGEEPVAHPEVHPGGGEEELGRLLPNIQGLEGDKLRHQDGSYLGTGSVSLAEPGHLLHGAPPHHQPLGARQLLWIPASVEE